MDCPKPFVMLITEAKLGKLDVYVAILASNTQESSIFTVLNEACNCMRKSDILVDDTRI